MTDSPLRSQSNNTPCRCGSCEAARAAGMTPVSEQRSQEITESAGREETVTKLEPTKCVGDATERLPARCPMVRLDNLEVHSWRDDIACRWHACLREFDLNAKLFSGATQREAIDQLLDYYEQDNGELRE